LPSRQRIGNNSYLRLYTMFKLITYQRYFWIIGFLLTLSACRKDKITLEPYDNSQGELDYFMSFVPETPTTTIFILQGENLAKDTMLTTSNGVRVHIQDNDLLFTQENGTAQPCTACNNVQIAITEVLKTGDWISRKLPYVNTDSQLEKHIGAVKISVTCDGKLLKLAADRHLKVYIPAKDATGNYRVSYTQTDDKGTFTPWESGSPDAVFNATWSATPFTPDIYEGFEILSKRLGWVSALAPVDMASTGDFCVELPMQFDQDNTRVFAIFEAENTFAEMQPQLNTGVFCLDNAILNKPVRIFSISKAGNQYWLGEIKTISASDAGAQLTPVTSNEQAIIKFLRGL
jgi:hypothetical protein